MHLDRRTDLFSVGILLYEMTLGRRLFRGETVTSMHATLLSSLDSATASPGSIRAHRNILPAGACAGTTSWNWPTCRPSTTRSTGGGCLRPCSTSSPDTGLERVSRAPIAVARRPLSSDQSGG